MSYDPYDLTSPTLPIPFEEILDELERLSREHLLFYRVQVGGLLLRHFWNDDPALFSSKNPQKQARLNLFFVKNEEALRRYGLSRRQAHASIRVHIVVRSLPATVAQQLFLSQVLELARLTDPTQRARVALAAVERDWSVVELRDAISAVQTGHSVDALDANTSNPSLTPPEPTAAAPLPAPGRLVTRAERMVDDLSTWRMQWSQVDASRLRRPQRRRLRTAVAALETQIAELRAFLGADDAPVAATGEDR